MERAGERMPTGKVKFWNANRRYGFIAPDQKGPDLFVHVSGVMSSTDLRHDQRVSFEIEMNERQGKPQAVRVRALRPGIAFAAVCALAFVVAMVFELR